MAEMAEYARIQVAKPAQALALAVENISRCPSPAPLVSLKLRPFSFVFDRSNGSLVFHNESSRSMTALRSASDKLDDARTLLDFALSTTTLETSVPAPTGQGDVD